MSADIDILQIHCTVFLENQHKTSAWALKHEEKMTEDVSVAKRRRRRKHVLFWVFLGAGMSVSFTVAMFMTLVGGYYFHFIPFWAMQKIAHDYWPLVCLCEVIAQVIPMNVRQQTQGWDVVADQWTSFIPTTGCVVILTAMFFGGFSLGPEGWRIFAESVLTAFVELQLLAVSNKLIAAARGSEETPV